MWADETNRNPLLLLRLSGLFLLRCEPRALSGLLFHAPPRATRLIPGHPAGPASRVIIADFFATAATRRSAANSGQAMGADETRRNPLSLRWKSGKSPLRREPRASPGP